MTEPGSCRFLSDLWEVGYDIGTGVPPWGGGSGSWSVSLPTINPTPDSITSAINPSQPLEDQGVMGVIEVSSTMVAPSLCIDTVDVSVCGCGTWHSPRVWGEVDPTLHPSIRFNAYSSSVGVH